MEKQLSKKLKAILDPRVQLGKPGWYLKRKFDYANNVELREELQKGTTFIIIGDPLGHFEGMTRYLLCECKVCGFKRSAAITDLKSKKIDCYGCFRNRLELEAKNVGLDLLGDSRDGNAARRHYRFIGCGHERDIPTADVRIDSVSCGECYSNKLTKNLEEHGLEKLSEPSASRKGSKASFMRARYKLCGHERDVLTTHVGSNTIGECEICYEEGLQVKYARPQGFEIIGKEPGPNRLIEFSNCGHRKVIGISNMKTGAVTCQICITAKFKSEAVEAGLEYICPDSEKSVGKKKHWYKAPCGHNFLSRPGHIRIGHWTCRECNAGYLDRVSNLYIFEISSVDGFTFLKLGYSLKPEYRKLDYILSSGTTAILLKKVQVSSGALAIKLENTIHVKYKEFNLDKNVIKKYLTESGFTECYPIELKSDLIAELVSVESLEVGND